MEPRKKANAKHDSLANNARPPTPSRLHTSREEENKGRNNNRTRNEIRIHTGYNYNNLKFSADVTVHRRRCARKKEQQHAAEDATQGGLERKVHSRGPAIFSLILAFRLLIFHLANRLSSLLASFVMMQATSEKPSPRYPFIQIFRLFTSARSLGSSSPPQ